MKQAQALDAMQPSYIREILSSACRDDVISLAGGLPDESLFPMALMHDSIAQLSTKAELFQYGNTVGYAPLISYLSEQFKLPSTHSGLICTGSQQALDLIARAYINPNDIVAMEAPSYLGALQVFALAQADVKTVEQTEQGPDLSALETLFSEREVKFFYAVPDFHNPTGLCWSLETRKKVAELCIQYQVTLIEDVPYRELRFSGEALPLVSEFCLERSLVMRSFSKIATPGIRIGLLTGPKTWLEPIVRVKQGADLHSSVPMQAVLLDLLQHDLFTQHLSDLKAVYKQRHDSLLNLLNTQLPEGCSANAVEGGMFIWLRLPDCDIDAVAKQMLDKGVAVVPSSVFYPDNTKKNSALRLNFTNAEEALLKEAVERLALVLKKSL